MWLRIDGVAGVEAVLDVVDVDRRETVAFADVGDVAVAAWTGDGAVWLWLLDDDELIAGEVLTQLTDSGFAAARVDAPPIAPEQRVRVGEWPGVDRAAIERSSVRDALLTGFVGLVLIAVLLVALVGVVQALSWWAA